MNKVHTFKINDEPLVDKSTGIREATLVYKGGRYVYAEVCTETGKIQAPVHTSDTPEMEVALDRLTQMETRKIIVIDANENPVAAAIIEDSHYDLKIPNYVEELPSGEQFIYEYSETVKLNEIYDVNNMKFNLEKNDFEYKYVINDITDEAYIESIDSQLSYISDQLAENTYSESQLAEIDEFKQKLLALKASYDGSVKHWKFPFPTCSAL
jgi:hypothetical protein